jgi:hypothetical protein
VRIAVRVVVLLMLLAGGVFFLQGIGVIPGSFMTGRAEWVVIGGALVAGAIASLGLGMLGPRSGR